LLSYIVCPRIAPRLFMKILHIVKTAVGAGWVYQQVRVLCSIGFNVVVVLPSASVGLAPKYKDAGATVIPLAFDFPSRRPWQIPSLLRACKNLVAEVRPDVIHTHHVGTTLMLRAALGQSSSIPRIFQVPGPLHLEHPFFARLDISSAGPQDHWIACCRWTNRKYRSLGVPSDRVFLSYPGTDLNSFNEHRTGALRRELNLPPDVPLVGMVCYMYAPKRFLGQSTGLKGHEDFISAFQIAQKTIPNLRGVIIGGAWNGAAKYEQRIRRIGHSACPDSLTFLGTRSDIPALYPDLDLAVVPSHSENVGGAVEPLLSGVPVVSTNVGGLPDLVQPGITGTLVPPRDPQSLAAATLSSLKNPAEARRLALAGQQMARQLFNVETTAREVAQIYSQIASTPLHSRLPA
jgi:glycosyltransferase involved in cell wall biosynthesis